MEHTVSYLVYHPNTDTQSSAETTFLNAIKIARCRNQAQWGLTQWRTQIRIGASFEEKGDNVVVADMTCIE